MLLLLFNPSPGMATTPTVVTNAISDIEKYQVTANGEVTSDGGATITERGFVYSLSANPTTADNKVTVSGTTGAMSTLLTSLVQGTTYHVRAFATNSEGTSYGSDVEFATLSIQYKNFRVMKVQGELVGGVFVQHLHLREVFANEDDS